MNTTVLRRLALPATLLGLALPVSAADHGDGFKVNEDTHYDISDFFVFPYQSEDGDPRLSFILSVDPKNAELDAGVSYRVRTRPIDGFSYGPFAPQVRDQGLTVDCRPNKALDRIACKAIGTDKKGRPVVLDKAEVAVDDRSGGANPAFRIFAGKAADQLFSDRARVRMPVWEDRGFNELKPKENPDDPDVAEWPGVNSQDGKDVMSIVVDLDTNTFYGRDVGLLATVGETLHVHPARGKGHPETLIQIDRMGRVEVTVFILRDTNDPLRDLWNQEDTFNIDPDNIPAYRAGLQEGMERLDLFELSPKGADVHDWPVPHPWVELMMHEFLIVDVRCPVDPATNDKSYLKIEENAYRHIAPIKGECEAGGRVPNEDVIDITLTVFINGLDSPKPSRGVGVPNPARPTGSDFPFVAPPFNAGADGSY